MIKSTIDSLVFSGVHFMKTMPSGSVKIISQFIIDTNIEKKMWPIKLISDYQLIIDASLLDMG